MEQITAWFKQLDFSSLLPTLLILIASLLSITVHESCHGLAALALGDDTAKRAGRISLNPLRHVDLMGLILMALVHFGWAKPVPVRAENFRHPKRDMALTALAGPVSNLLLAFAASLLAVVFFRLMRRNPDSSIFPAALTLMQDTAMISGGLAVFNLIPVPPLDGSKVLFSFLPLRAYAKLMRYERYGMLLLALLLLTGVLDPVLNFLCNGLLQALFAAASWIVA